MRAAITAALAADEALDVGTALEFPYTWRLGVTPGASVERLRPRRRLVLVGATDLAATGSDEPAERRWQVRFDGTAPAAPTEVTLHNQAGAHTRPLIYERSSGGLGAETITGVGTVGWSLDTLADTLAVAGRLLDDRVVSRKEYARD